jgi:phosphoribosylformylglycinamidine synthase
LYNETDGQPIMPAPAIGGVGLLDDVSKAMTIAIKAEGETIFLIGETHGHVGQSLYLREIFGKEEGAPPPVNLTAERRHGKFIRSLIAEREITACHDVSDGGLLVAVAEMALAGNVGCALEIEGADAGFWFGEDQARYVVTARDPDLIEQKALAAGVPFLEFGVTGGKDLSIKGNKPLALSELKALHESWLPHYMEG